jgi:S1-C subfamily serine protease
MGLADHQGPGRRRWARSEWRLTAALAALFLLCGHVSAGGLDAQVLQKVKGSTVFVKVADGKEKATGSGFVVRSEGSTVYVVTNDHVVDLLPESRYRRGVVTPAVTLVFHSGTKNEQSVRGEVVAADMRRDLAIVKASSVKNPPPALDLTQTAELVETMPVYILGFPLGELLSTNKANPATTVGRGSVASLRNDEAGELAIVQIDGDMTPGNSGGPVVDAQGRLVGVAAATVRNRGIGFAIPAATLTRSLKGRVLDHYFVTKPAIGSLEVRVELGVFDPYRELKGTSFAYLPGSKPAAKKLAGLSGVKTVSLERRPQQLVGNFTLKLAGPADPRISFQAAYTDGAQEKFVTNVRESSLPRAGGSAGKRSKLP